MARIIEARNFQNGVEVKVMADGGQGFLKMSLTVLPKDYDKIMDSPVSESGSIQRKRSLYSEGGSCGKTQTLTGVNRLIMLCCVPDVSESYENMKM